MDIGFIPSGKQTWQQNPQTKKELYSFILFQQAMFWRHRRVVGDYTTIYFRS